MTRRGGVLSNALALGLLLSSLPAAAQQPGKVYRIGNLIQSNPTVAAPLLGAYALEGLRLAADPVRRRLTPVPGLLLSG